MQCNRGANNRLDEANRDRNNGNRMCDTQNNNRGGYNVGKLAYYVGEKVPICWTNQHSSGEYQLRGAEFVIQYMCDKLARDGTSTTTIRDNPTQCENFDCDRDVEYGRHESMEYYQYCKATSRNKGLFTANQNLAGNRKSRRHTRQNPQGTRRGYECPEERDYYPWWGASPWKDIVVYTNNIERCAAYKAESQNVKERWECKFTDWYWQYILKGYYNNEPGYLPITKSECDASPLFTDDEDGPFNTNNTYKIYNWTRIPAHNEAQTFITSPECKESIYTRTNHHGIIGRKYWTHDWIVPNEVNEDSAQCCVIRLRYNITTSDYEAWSSNSSILPGVDHNNNSYESNPNPDRNPANIKIWEKYGLSLADVIDSFNYDDDQNNVEQKTSRGYVFRNNPRVDPFGDTYLYDTTNDYYSRLQLQLAINTNQFGRTFQDRTHCFQIKPKPNYMASDAKIQLITVQGKRGNIVQTYPATEYFFYPEPALITRDTYIHFCWTGSNTNPNNNDGQGKQGTDRSNICPLTQVQWDKTIYGEVDNNVQDRYDGTVGDLANNYPDYVNEPTYGFPMYYNYANKRDVPKKARSTSVSDDTSAGIDIGTYHGNEEIINVSPFNDDYNIYYFSEKGDRSDMAGLSQQLLDILCTQRRIDLEYYRDFYTETEINNLPDNNPFGLLDYGNMEELDDAGTTFCLEPKLVQTKGCWNYLSTRNNNFSNRSQKGSICVGDVVVTTQSVSTDGKVPSGIEIDGEALLFVSPNTVENGYTFQLELYTWFQRDKESSVVEIRGPDGGALNTNVLRQGSTFEIHVSYKPTSLSKPVAYYRPTSTSEWTKHSQATIEQYKGSSYGVIQVREEGYYTIQNQPNIFAYIAYTIAVVSMGVVIFMLVTKKCKKQ